MIKSYYIYIKLPCCSFVCPRPTSLAKIPLTATPFLGEFFLFLLVFLAFNDFFLFLFSDFFGGLFSITRGLSACWVSGVKFVKLYCCLLSSSLRSGVNSEIIDKKAGQYLLLEGKFMSIAEIACESIRFSFALHRWGRFARRKHPQRRRAKEKRMLSQATTERIEERKS